MPHDRQDTSLEAAAQADKAGAEERVLALFRERKALTRDEVSEALGMPIQSVCPVVYALKHRGVLVVTAERRQTRAGRRAQVMALVETPR